MPKIIAELKDNTGAASVLVVLIMIVFITLGLLAMVFANSNYQLARKTYAAERDYYTLDRQAETILSEIDALLIPLEAKTEDNHAYSKLAIDALIKWGKSNPGYGAAFVEPALSSAIPKQTPGGYFEFTVGDKDSSLKVQIKPVLDPSDPAKRYEILRWQKINQKFAYNNSDDILIY